MSSKPRAKVDLPVPPLSPVTRTIRFDDEKLDEELDGELDEELDEEV